MGDVQVAYWRGGGVTVYIYIYKQLESLPDTNLSFTNL